MYIAPNKQSKNFPIAKGGLIEMSDDNFSRSPEEMTDGVLNGVLEGWKPKYVHHLKIDGDTEQTQGIHDHPMPPISSDFIKKLNGSANRRPVPEGLRFLVDNRYKK